MKTSKPTGGTAHSMPQDLSRALLDNVAALYLWESITPLARNEWICWTITVKQQKTREAHVKRVIKDLESGKRRPCCWVGCIHRTDKKPSPWAQKVLINKK